MKQNMSTFFIFFYKKILKVTRIYLENKNMKSNNSLLSHRGYSLSKKQTESSLLRSYKQKLTIIPYVEKQEFAHLAEPIHVYFETEQRLYMPRFFGINEIGPPDEDKLSQQKFKPNPNLKFQGTLRQDQSPVFDVTSKSLKEQGGGVISIECGGGKTTISLAIACELSNSMDETQAKEVPLFVVAVVCHTSQMMKQWFERCKQYVPTARYVVHLLSLYCSAN